MTRAQQSNHRQQVKRNIAWLMDELYALGILHSPYRLYAAQWRPELLRG